MPMITMWRRGRMKCVLLVKKSTYTVRVLDGIAIEREKAADTADDAVLLAEVWSAQYPEPDVDPAVVHA
jgi:hypothetical protein